MDRLVEANDFQIPEVYIDRQIENQFRAQVREIDRPRCRS